MVSAQRKLAELGAAADVGCPALAVPGTDRSGPLQLFSDPNRSGSSPGTGRAFENGSLAYIAGGNYACEQICFAVLYNYLLDGTRVIADPAVNLAMNNINLNSLDDYNNYIKYLDSAVPAYTAQELLDMTHYVDETFTAEKMVEVCKTYSLEDVMARHADLVQ